MCLQFLRLESPSSLLAHTLPTLGSANSVNPKAVGTRPGSAIQRDCESRGRAVLLGSLTLPLATWVPLPNKVSCLISVCVSSDNSFLSVRQEPPFGPWQESPSLQHLDQQHLHPLRTCDKQTQTQ